MLAVCQQFGVQDNLIPGIASGFGGGMGGTGSVCGAVSGAVMAIGLRQGRATTAEGMPRAYEFVRELRSRFEEAMGSIYCRELTGFDFGMKLEGFIESGVPQRVCFPAVGTAYRLALEMIEKASHE